MNVYIYIYIYSKQQSIDIERNVSMNMTEQKTYIDISTHGIGTNHIYTRHNKQIITINVIIIAFVNNQYYINALHILQLTNKISYLMAIKSYTETSKIYDPTMQIYGNIINETIKTLQTNKLKEKHFLELNENLFILKELQSALEYDTMNQNINKYGNIMNLSNINMWPNVSSIKSETDILSNTLTELNIHFYGTLIELINAHPNILLIWTKCIHYKH